MIKPPFNGLLWVKNEDKNIFEAVIQVNTS